jgi:carbamoyltransferase
LPGSTDFARWADIAASIQAFTEEAMLAVAAEAHRQTGARALCLSGGVALNVVANRRLAQAGPFAELYVHPAAGDAGGALGAALWASHCELGDPRSDERLPNGLGEAFAAESVGRFLRDCAVPHHTFSVESALVHEVARRLAAGEVGGFMHGRAEWGPRALGHRSILADPRDAGMRDRVNAKVKYREPFRPFAPAVLADEASRWFDLGRGADRHLWASMGSVAEATAEARAHIPAVIHIDGTARLQLVERQHEPRLYRLLEAFRAQTGIGVLLNTSLNLKDEPICNSPAEAYGTFMRSDLDFLVIEDCLLSKGEIACDQ